MATQLLKLRQVPEDELEEIYALLEEHEIAVYETSAGNWGISMPALWASNDEQAAQAKGLLEDYAAQRFTQQRSQYESLKAVGEARTWLDIAAEKPLQFIVYIVIVLVLIGLMTLPFLKLML